MTIQNTVEAAAERILGLEAEVESAGLATTGGADLAAARAALHDWVDSVTGVVASPGMGRVTLIHAGGGQSSIASPELPYLLSKPVSFGT